MTKLQFSTIGRIRFTVLMTKLFTAVHRQVKVRLGYVQMEHCPDTLDEVFEEDDVKSKHLDEMVVE